MVEQREEAPTDDGVKDVYGEGRFEFLLNYV